MADKPSKEQKMLDQWRRTFTEEGTTGHGIRRFFRFWPSSPRCGMCLAPFKGIGGLVLRPTGFSTPSRKNPNWCKQCFEAAPMGGFEIEIGVLFADIRGFTAYSEGRRPEEVASLANRFYAVASQIFAEQDAVIDKLVGDEVMAFWTPGLAGRETYISKMVAAADELLRNVGFGRSSQPWLPLGLGLDHGLAYVGNVGHGDVKDFTAIGDTVNTAARLQSHAKPGQIVMSERVYEIVADRYPNAPPSQLELKGKSEPVAVRTVDLNVAVPV
jgi:adenylate cyclase